MPGLGTSLGRGAATNYMQDVPNSDCVLFMGSNMAEAHPVGFRWPMKAKERGATLDNEENYLIKKLFGGGLGVVSIENQARI